MSYVTTHEADQKVSSTVDPALSVGERSDRGCELAISMRTEDLRRGVKYGTRQNREALLQCEQQSVGERSGRGHDKFGLYERVA